MLTERIQQLVDGVLQVEEGQVRVVEEDEVATSLMDQLVWEAVFGVPEDQVPARWLIWETAQSLGIQPASIHELYIARGHEEAPLDFTVPAMNLRGMAYDMSRAVFSTAQRLDVGALICELARSEMGYADQPPEEYVSVVLAGAIREGFRGPIFIQGDHFQTKQAKPGQPKEGEVDTIKSLIEEAIGAGFYNIDIDTSTLVDLDLPTEEEQQQWNVEYSAEFVEHVRAVEPDEVTVSLGGEIGHIGGKNSTVEELHAYLNGFNSHLPEDLTGMSKISVQTGTSHGGVVLPDGSLADVDVDFSVLAEISKACRSDYQIGGAVQHGASTLPDEYFRQFPTAEAIEVHLATGFQNIILDHPSFPPGLLKDMYAWLDQEKSDERKEDQTDEQFHYKLRKKAWGQFKRACWDIDSDIRETIRRALEERFEFMFRELNVLGTTEMISRTVAVPEIHKDLEDFGKPTVTKKVTKGLAD